MNIEDDPSDLADYLMSRKFKPKTYKWFSEWKDELQDLYGTIDNWCKKIGWNLTG
jgi:hypothetical protein